MCDSKAVYADKPEYIYVDKMKGMPMDTGDKVAKDHISTMNGCGMKDITTVKTVEKGQSWTTTGYYDYSKATPNEVRHKENNKTGPGEVMAISIVLVAVKPGEFPIIPAARKATFNQIWANNTSGSATAPKKT